jgi:hypothetical protein
LFIKASEVCGIEMIESTADKADFSGDYLQDVFICSIL